MTANEKLTAEIAALNTKALKKISLRLAVSADADEIIVATYTERELEERLTEAEFLDHMDVVESFFDLAA